MNIERLVQKIYDVIDDEENTPESFKKGEEFENYAIQKIFVKEYYEILEMTHSFHANKRSYIKASLNPDFKLRDRYTNKEFYVEMKFRTNLFENKLHWCTPDQLKRYQEINKHTTVFILIGDGGKPKRPDNLSLIKIDQAKYTGLYESLLGKYAINPKSKINSKELWNR